VTGELPYETRVNSFDLVSFNTFADDLVVHSASINTLNPVLSRLKIMNDYDLVLSETKYVGMFFLQNGLISRVNTSGNSHFPLNGAPLSTSDSFKYLGLRVSQDLKTQAPVS
jgi:hypothetical protein